MDHEYPRHEIYIHNVTRLSAYGDDVKSSFKKIDKHEKKYENNLYKKYGTTRKCWGVVLDIVNDMLVWIVVTIIATKLTCHYTRGECMVDAIYIAEACVHGDQINWSSYLLQELFEGANDVYSWSTYFVFRYLFNPLSMSKWCLPEGHDIATIAKEEPHAYMYAPWRSTEDTVNREFNDLAFGYWYNKMVIGWMLFHGCLFLYWTNTLL